MHIAAEKLFGHVAEHRASRRVGQGDASRGVELQNAFGAGVDDQTGVRHGGDQAYLGTASHDDRPQVVADQFQFSGVRFLVLRRLVADAHQQPDHPAFNDRYANMANKVGVSLRITLALRQRLVVVVCDRAPQAHRIGPYARRRDRVVVVVGGRTVLERTLRPGAEREGFLVVIDEVDVADFAFRKTHRLLDAELQNLVLVKLVRLLAHRQHRRKPLIGGAQTAVGGIQRSGAFGHQLLEVGSVVIQFLAQTYRFGDVLDDRKKQNATLRLDRGGAHLDGSYFSAGQAVRKDEEILLTRLRHRPLLNDFIHRQQVDLIDLQCLEMLDGIAIEARRGSVGICDDTRIRIDQKHHERILLKHLVEAGFTFPQRFRRHLALGNVAVNPAVAEQRAVGTEDGHAVGLHLTQAAILVAKRVVELAEGFAAGDDGGKLGAYSFDLPGRHEVERGLADDFCRGVTQQVQHVVRDKGINALGIEFPDPVGGGPGDVLEALFAGAQNLFVLLALGDVQHGAQHTRHSPALVLHRRLGDAHPA